MGSQRIAAAVLLMLFSTFAQAEVRNVQAGDVAGLIQAFKDANADTSELMVVVIKGTGTFKFTDAYQDTGYALPPLEGARVAILVEERGVRLVFNPGTGQAKSGGTTVEMGGISLFKDREDEPAVLFLKGLFIGFSLFGPSATGPDDLPTLEQGPNTSGNVINAQGSIVILDSVRVLANLEAAILAEATRLIGNSMSISGNGVTARTLTSETPPSQAELDSVVDELSDFVTIAAANFRLKAANRAQLQAAGERFKSLADEGVYVIAGSVVRTTFRPVNLSGAGKFHVEDSFLEQKHGSLPVIEVNGFTTAASEVEIRNSVISHPDAGQAIEITRGHLDLDGVTVAAEDALDIKSDASVTAYRSILGTATRGGVGSDRDDNCDVDSFSDGLTSLGYNISADASCGLGKSTDRQNTDPKLTDPTGDSLVPGLAANSPAIDGGPAGLVGGQLPCGTADLLGTARPQDGDGDGPAECDVGALEVASHGSIDARQSGAFYDASRAGEGVFVEMLSPDAALVYLFSYTPDGQRPFWALGVGQVVGNGIVIPKADFQTTRGGMFGPDFDPAHVTFTPFADLSLSFPDCRNTANTGSLVVAPNQQLGFGPLLSHTGRLTFILDCGTRMPEGPGYSGSFYDPAHAGEGIILEVVGPDTVVVQWFTYDPMGRQYWIQGVGTLNGTVITVDDAVSFKGPHYGPGYHAMDEQKIHWGTVTIRFHGCDSATLRYDSMIPGFGSGRQELTRLTTLNGVDCGQ